MKTIFIFIIGLVILTSTVLFSREISINETTKSSMVLVLEWLYMEYELIEESPNLSEGFSKIVFTKLSSSYIAGVSSSDIRGDSKKAVCKMYFDSDLKKLLSSSQQFILFEKYLNSLWLDIKPSFKSNASDCEFDMPPRKKRH